MRLTILGSGAADGWPNAFCECFSCVRAWSAGYIRGQTSAILDDTVLIDCGPQTPYQAMRLGQSLAPVRVMVFTHAHSDHFGPQALLHRSWVRDGPLHIIGPAAVIEAARMWVSPHSNVTFTVVSAGDSVDTGAYRIRVLPANHRVIDDGDCVLFDIADAHGARMLWATDTGPLPLSWYQNVATAGYQMVCLEQTFGNHKARGNHLNLDSFGDTVDRLRACGAVVDATTVLAVHLSHFNPDEEQLQIRLKEYGAVLGTDGLTITTGVS